MVSHLGSKLDSRLECDIMVKTGEKDSKSKQSTKAFFVDFNEIVDEEKTKVKDRKQSGTALFIPLTRKQPKKRKAKLPACGGLGEKNSGANQTFTKEDFNKVDGNSTNENSKTVKSKIVQRLETDEFNKLSESGKNEKVLLPTAQANETAIDLAEIYESKNENKFKNKNIDKITMDENNETETQNTNINKEEIHATINSSKDAKPKENLFAKLLNAEKETFLKSSSAHQEMNAKKESKESADLDENKNNKSEVENHDAREILEILEKENLKTTLKFDSVPQHSKTEIEVSLNDTGTKIKGKKKKSSEKSKKMNKAKKSRDKNDETSDKSHLGKTLEIEPLIKADKGKKKGGKKTKKTASIDSPRETFEIIASAKEKVGNKIITQVIENSKKTTKDPERDDTSLRTYKSLDSTSKNLPLLEKRRSNSDRMINNLVSPRRTNVNSKSKDGLLPLINGHKPKPLKEIVSVDENLLNFAQNDNAKDVSEIVLVDKDDKIKTTNLTNLPSLHIEQSALKSPSSREFDSNTINSIFDFYESSPSTRNQDGKPLQTLATLTTISANNVLSQNVAASLKPPVEFLSKSLHSPREFLAPSKPTINFPENTNRSSQMQMKSFVSAEFPSSIFSDSTLNDIAKVAFEERKSAMQGVLEQTSWCCSTLDSCSRKPVSPRPVSNQEIVEWQKGKVIDRGAFGVVYQGLTSQAQLIAVKEVDISGAKDPHKSYAKLADEIGMLKALHHKNIIKFMGTAMEAHSVRIFMEYIPGGSLAALINTFGSLNEPVYRHYTKQICEAVRYIHQENVVHRDIKGANILVTVKGVVKLIDFGCAKQINITSLMHTVKGTPYWMSPEVITNSGSNTKTDIWVREHDKDEKLLMTDGQESIGCTVIEMATGKPPWSEYEPMAAMFEIAKEDSPLPSLDDQHSNYARDFVNRCLTRNMHERPSAKDLLEHPFLNP